MEIVMKSLKQGSGQKNLPGKAKKPQSPNFGMTSAPKMKKGGSVGCGMKKGGKVKAARKS
jgi:hypothetical protein